MNERPAPVEPAELTDQELLRTYNEELLQTYNARNYINEERVRAATIAGLRAVIAADRARRAVPPAEGGLTDYELEIAYGSAYTPAWDISDYCGVHLDGLRAVAAAALAKRFPPADGEAAGRPPLHIAITHQPKTTPPAEGEVGL